MNWLFTSIYTDSDSHSSHITSTKSFDDNQLWIFPLWNFNEEHCEHFPIFLILLNVNVRRYDILGTLIRLITCNYDRRLLLSLIEFNWVRNPPLLEHWLLHSSKYFQSGLDLVYLDTFEERLESYLYRSTATEFLLLVGGQTVLNWQHVFTCINCPSPRNLFNNYKYDCIYHSIVLSFPLFTDPEIISFISKSF